jgi:hypothetical protein
MTDTGISEIPEGRWGGTGSATLPGIAAADPGCPGEGSSCRTESGKRLRRIDRAVAAGRPKRLFFMGASLQRARIDRNDMCRLHNHALPPMPRPRELGAWGCMIMQEARAPGQEKASTLPIFVRHAVARGRGRLFDARAGPASRFWPRRRPDTPPSPVRRAPGMGPARARHSPRMSSRVAGGPRPGGA